MLSIANVFRRSLSSSTALSSRPLTTLASIARHLRARPFLYGGALIAPFGIALYDSALRRSPHLAEKYARIASRYDPNFTVMSILGVNAAVFLMWQVKIVFFSCVYSTAMPCTYYRRGSLHGHISSIICPRVVLTVRHKQPGFGILQAHSRVDFYRGDAMFGLPRCGASLHFLNSLFAAAADRAQPERELHAFVASTFSHATVQMR